LAREQRYRKANILDWEGHKLSTKPFFMSLPGAISCHSTPVGWRQDRIAIEVFFRNRQQAGSMTPTSRLRHPRP